MLARYPLLPPRPDGALHEKLLVAQAPPLRLPRALALLKIRRSCYRLRKSAAKKQTSRRKRGGCGDRNHLSPRHARSLFVLSRSTRTVTGCKTAATASGALFPCPFFRKTNEHIGILHSPPASPPPCSPPQMEPVVPRSFLDWPREGGNQKTGYLGGENGETESIVQSCGKTPLSVALLGDHYCSFHSPWRQGKTPIFFLSFFPARGVECPLFLLQFAPRPEPGRIQLDDAF
ncbi:hypothetical protein MPH_09872 [Macrophomina phaseolina MS6]|uniref:Uncharacterized protein n=1 Tax=Macrophomina phaseolina (strain MS6) TaxID=1126212 RepID=K2QT67_MACPH|nr:hypothetical protein MPH_09872 [Macrophomina phaseolina MS6]